MLDMLIKQICEGLSAVEERELAVLDGDVSAVHLRNFERAVAAITLSGSAPRREMPPAALQARIADQARAFFAQRSVVEFKPAIGKSSNASTASRSAAGWIAAAACLLLAILGWLRSPQQIEAQSVAKLTNVQTVIPAVPTVLQQRAALLAKAGAVKVSLAATKDPNAIGVSGDVVWDPDTQRGFLRFVGIAANDPKVTQYQAWIFDAARDMRFPVNAGVFDVSTDAAQIIVPIQAALPIGAPKTFAVTMEKPGGVVVSALKHVLVLGTI
jgi:hypothetical protein